MVPTCDRNPARANPWSPRSPRGTVMHVVDGPTTTNGYTWYEVTGGRGTGWVASTMFTSSNAEPPTGRYDDRRHARGRHRLPEHPEPAVDPGGCHRDDPAWHHRHGHRRPANPRAASAGTGWKPAYGRGWAVEQYLVIPGTGEARSRFVVGDHVAVDDRDGLRMRSGAGTGEQPRALASLWHPRHRHRQWQGGGRPDLASGDHLARLGMGRRKVPDASGRPAPTPIEVRARRQGHASTPIPSIFGRARERTGR